MINREKNRGTGRTTSQLVSAPHGAYFFCIGSVDYHWHLARRLGRDDLKVVSVLTSPSRAHDYAGLHDFNFVIDHAVDDVMARKNQKTQDQWMRIKEYLTACVRSQITENTFESHASTKG